MQRVLFILLFLLLGARGSLRAFDVTDITTLTDRDGLSQNTTRCLLADSRNFLWIGTINGLNRYDGRTFSILYPRLEGNRHPLTDNRVRELTEDARGLLWIRTFADILFCYDPQREQMVDYAPHDSIKRFQSVLPLPDGDVWLWGKQGCCRVHPVNGKPEAWYPSHQGLNGKQITFVTTDTEGDTWAGTPEGLFRIRGKQVDQLQEGRSFWSMQQAGDELYFATGDGLIAYHLHDGSFSPSLPLASEAEMAYARLCLLDEGMLLLTTQSDLHLFDTRTRRELPAASYFQGKRLRQANFLTDNRGGIWIYNKSGILWRHRPGNRFEPLQLMSEEVLSLIEQELFTVYCDSRDVCWITTFGNGLFALTPIGELQHFSTANILPTNYLFCVTEDRSGEIWVGTELGGLVKLSPSNHPFSVYRPASGKGMERYNAVRLIYEDSNGLYWMGTRDGTLHICTSALQHLHTQKIAEGLPYAMAEDMLGLKWVGTKSAGLLLFSPQGERQLGSYLLPERSGHPVASNNIYSILRDRHGRMWLATLGGGLQLAERNGQDKLHFRQFLFPEEHLNRMRILLEDRDGQIWAGTDDGVLVFHPDRLLQDPQQYTVLRPAGDRRTSGYNEVKALYEDHRGDIWIGTTGCRLYRLRQEARRAKTAEWELFGKDQGLPHQTIQSILEDDEGCLWVSTESCVARLNPENGRFENILLPNHRRTIVFNENACWKQRKGGNVLFGSYDGVYLFPPSPTASSKRYTPSVLLTNLWINGVETTPASQDSPLAESISSTRRLTLSHRQNSLTLECTLLHLHAPRFNLYTYLLEGYEEAWNPPSTHNLATYRNLPAGTYTFRVRGCNSLGDWSPQETSLQIVVLPPWWRSWQAWLCYLLAGIALLCYATRVALKMHRLRTAVEVERQLTEYKLHFFTNISHEFRTPLTLIRGVIDDLREREEVEPLIRRQLSLLTKNANRLLRLIEQLLEFRKLQNGRTELQPERTEAVDFFLDIHQNFRDMAAKKQIDYSFCCDEVQHFLLLDRGKMDKVAYNLLSNAFKHTPAGGTIRLSLRLLPEEALFQLSVEDSGPGIPADKRDRLFMRFEQITPSAGGIGIGLHLTHELVKAHQGTIAYTDSILGGACFTVSLPLHHTEGEQEEQEEKEKTIGSSNAPAEERMEAETETREAAQPLPSLAKPLQDYRIMIIDDDEEIRELLRDQLGRHFQLTMAGNGAEGLARLAEEQPDLVVCDVVMPEMNGLELTRRLRADFSISHIPVILLTAYTSEIHRLRGIEAGADAYVGKPFSIRYLLARITGLISQREQLQRRFATSPTDHAPQLETTHRDKLFLQQVDALIEQHIEETDFKLDAYAADFRISRTTFYNKLKALAGCSPGEYVRILRIKKAAELLHSTTLNISEISFQVGFNDPFYFSKCFKSTFGVSPTQYRKEETTDHSACPNEK